MDGDNPYDIILDTTSLKNYIEEIQTQYWRQHSKQVNYTASFKAPEKIPDRSKHSREERDRGRDGDGEKTDWTGLRPKRFDKIKLLNIAKQMAYANLGQFPRPSSIPVGITRSYDTYFNNGYLKPSWSQVQNFCHKLEEKHEKELAKQREGGTPGWSGGL